MSVYINGKDVIWREIKIVEHHLHNKEIWFGGYPRI